jgi:hypothetical protein
MHQVWTASALHLKQRGQDLIARYDDCGEEA